MAVTRFDLCSRALIKLDAEPVASFSENRKEAQVCAVLYEPTRDSELSGFDWNFNAGTFTLSSDPDAPSDPRWQYSYALPADHLRTIDVVDQSGAPVEYVEENRTILADASVVILKYQRKLDESKFPAFFQDLLVARLVYEFCEPIRGSNSLAQRAWNEYQAKRKQARAIDLQSNPPVQIVNPATSTWVSARNGVNV